MHRQVLAEAFQSAEMLEGTRHLPPVQDDWTPKPSPRVLEMWAEVQQASFHREDANEVHAWIQLNLCGEMRERCFVGLCFALVCANLFSIDKQQAVCPAAIVEAKLQVTDVPLRLDGVELIPEEVRRVCREADLLRRLIEHYDAWANAANGFRLGSPRRPRYALYLSHVSLPPRLERHVQLGVEAQLWERAVRHHRHAPGRQFHEVSAKPHKCLVVARAPQVRDKGSTVHVLRMPVDVQLARDPEARQLAAALFAFQVDRLWNLVPQESARRESQGMVQVAQVRVLWLLGQPVLVQHDVVVVTGDDVRPTHDATEVRSTVSHVVVHEGSALQHPPCHAKGHVRTRPVRACLSPFLEPARPVFGEEMRLVRKRGLVLRDPAVAVEAIARIDDVGGRSRAASFPLDAHDPGDRRQLALEFHSQRGDPLHIRRAIARVLHGTILVLDLRQHNGAPFSFQKHSHG
eukprot:scaffold3_cov273-Pinguiococcus_pyrenoidosus.AAC.13